MRTDGLDGAGSGWAVARSVGSAAAFHGRDVAPGSGRQVWLHEVTAPALVLGSTQGEDVADAGAAAAAGVEVVRRRSGGGAVLVEPGGVMWVDVVVPPGDPLWVDDVARAAHWVGRAWVEALAGCGVAGAEVHRGGVDGWPWSGLVCFAGRGPGEVTVGGRKVVGLAQRRTRHGARFQTAALLRWEPARLVGLLRLAPDDRTRVAAEVADRAAAVPVPGPALARAFLAALP